MTTSRGAAVPSRTVEPAVVHALRVADARNDRLVLLRLTVLVATGYAVAASLQSAYVYSRLIPGWDAVTIWQRLGANAAAVTALALTLVGLRAWRATKVWQMLLAVVGASVVASGTRLFVQVALDASTLPDLDTRQAELASGFAIAVISSAIGYSGLVSRRSSRARTRTAERDAVHVELAVQALEQEEIRVRREVAEGLHGTLQQKLVLVDARLASVLSRVGSGLDDADRDALEWVRAELDQARQIDVREMSRLLYPDRLELGLVPAVRALLGRLPSSIATRLEVSDAVREVDDPGGSRLTVSERLLAVRVVEEGVTNALKHGPASSVRVDLALDGRRLLVAVENDGELYDPASAGAASGTERLRQRLSLVGGSMELGPGPVRGARLEARMPLGGHGD
ncbi:sensor histidine kinase [Cellulomonas sp. URHB0016]